MVSAHAIDYKPLTQQGLMGRIPPSRRFDAQLAGALQMPLKRRANEGPFLRKLSGLFHFRNAQCYEKLCYANESSCSMAPWAP